MIESEAIWRRISQYVAVLVANIMQMDERRFGVSAAYLHLFRMGTHRRRYSTTFPMTSSTDSFTMTFFPVVVEIIVSGVDSMNSIRSALITIGSP